MAEIKYKFPKQLAVCADRIYQLREERLAKKREVDELEAEEKALKEHVIKNLPKSEASGVAGKIARVAAITKEVPQVKDWDLFHKHVKKTGEFDLLQRRLTDSAIQERWDAGKKIPGVESFTVVTLSITKV